MSHHPNASEQDSSLATEAVVWTTMLAITLIAWIQVMSASWRAVVLSLIWDALWWLLCLALVLGFLYVASWLMGRFKIKRIGGEDDRVLARLVAWLFLDVGAVSVLWEIFPGLNLLWVVAGCAVAAVLIVHTYGR